MSKFQLDQIQILKMNIMFLLCDAGAKFNMFTYINWSFAIFLFSVLLIVLV